MKPITITLLSAFLLGACMAPGAVVIETLTTTFAVPLELAPMLLGL